MSDKQKDYGLLLNPDIKLHRTYFKQMVKLLGINCQYYAPLDGKTYNLQGDLEAHYEKPLKKMGWVAELQENSSIIHVPYDLHKLEVGALFEVPSGLDDAKPRLFRVISMQNIMVYPASIACEIAPEYYDTDELTTVTDFTKTNFTMLVDNEEDD